MEGRVHAAGLLWQPVRQVRDLQATRQLAMSAQMAPQFDAATGALHGGLVYFPGAYARGGGQGEACPADVEVQVEGWKRTRRQRWRSA